MRRLSRRSDSTTNSYAATNYPTPVGVALNEAHPRSTARRRTRFSTHGDIHLRGDVRRSSQDTKRYIQAAAFATQTAATQFLHRLQSYQMFQPLFTASSAMSSSANGSPLSSQASRMSVYPSPSNARSFSTAAAAWQQVDAVLDASVGHILKRNTDDHFIVTMQQQVSGELAKVPSKRWAVVDSSEGRTGYRSSSAKDGNVIHTPALENGTPRSAFAQRWAADHPSNTAEGTRKEFRVATKVEQEQEQANRSFYLQALTSQLHELEKEQQRMAPKGVSRNHDADDATRLAHEAMLLAEEQTQQRRWEAFLCSEMGKGPRRNVSHVACEPSRCIVSDYLDDDDVHDWLHGRWPHHTHRHEGAALRIQCAYRSYLARNAMHRLRYARRQAFVTSLATETEAQRLWETSMHAQASASQSVAGIDTRVRAINFFVGKVNAVVAKRRARKLLAAQQESEVRSYAAVAIQRVYRGYRGRTYVKELLDPEIAEARVAAIVARSAAMIQSLWRGYRTRVELSRRRHAAGVIQRSYRSAYARYTFRALKQRQLLSVTADLKKYAIQRIEVWYLRCRTSKYGDRRTYVVPCALLQRVGRGYLTRQRAQEMTDLQKVMDAAARITCYWRRILAQRAAVEVLEALQRQRREVNRAVIEADAALTIQRAWLHYRRN